MRFSQRFSETERKDILKNSQQCIWEKEGLPGLQYLCDERKLSESTVKEYGLGYIPAEIRLQLAGRIIFPLKDASDNLVILTSRNVNGSDYLPVYWHEKYKKSNYLYGVSNAKAAMRKWGFVILVEGQVDVLQLHSKGVQNAVGLCGKSLSGVQLSYIYRYCDEIILLLDSDENKAGQKGTSEILRKVRDGYSHPHKISSVSLPMGYDPDEYVKEFGIDSLKRLIRKELAEMRKNRNAEYQFAQGSQ